MNVAGRAATSRLLRRVPASVAGTLVTAGTWTVGVLTSYLGLVTVAAIAQGSARPGGAPRPAPSTRRFAIMVPAHNEAALIGRALESFELLDYPRELFQVHVVADNCSDGTADTVRRSGFEVHERVDLQVPGKGPALNWLLERLLVDDGRFDSVVIVDADTTVHPAFLSHLAATLDDGARVAQAFYGVRDAGDSTATALRFAALACRHHVRPLGRTALGGSSGLYGNGMAFDVEVMQARAWTGHLTEDMEFQMELLLDGYRVAYVPGAMLEAEMPLSLEAAASQNERWELGRIEMARRYIPVLVSRVVKDRKLRAARADAVLDHMVPPLSVLMAATGATGLGAAMMALLRGRRIDRTNLLVTGISAATLTGHVLFGLRSVGAPTAMYRALWRAPRFVLWKFGLWLRILIKPSRVEWVRTARNSEG
jgi:1,2-diacylglycerol 3-beta-glucosyltransferase